MPEGTLTVAVAQISPVWLHREATVEKVATWMGKAAGQGAELVAFGEALIPGYPHWLAYTGGAEFDSKVQKEIHAHYLDQAVDLEAGHLEPLCEKARTHGIQVMVGCFERPRDRGGHTGYCSLVSIDARGRIGNVHRKVMPTYEERLSWGTGDGHGLRTFPVGPFRVGGLNCWENWLPLLRNALYAQGENLHVAVWPGSPRLTRDITRFIALEGRSYVLSASGVLRRDDLPSDLPHRELILESVPEILAGGGSCIAAPTGAWLVEPVGAEERLLVAELSLNSVYEERQNFDPAGHYSRPDVVRLFVNRERQNLLVEDPAQERGGRPSWMPAEDPAEEPAEHPVSGVAEEDLREPDGDPRRGFAVDRGRSAEAYDQASPLLVREIGNRVAQIIADCMESRRTQRITDPTPVTQLRALFDEPLPRRGTSHRELLDLFRERIVPHTLVSTSPGYMGLMNPTPVTIGIFADALASAVNQNQAASHHSPAGTVIEEVVIRWLGEATGYGADCYGHLTSGGTVANLTGLKLALHHVAPEVRERGLVAAGRRFTVYASDQVHFSVERSVDVLGLGREALRLVPTGESARVDPEAMRRMMEVDRGRGFTPLAIVGVAGATASGAVDPLDALADLAEQGGVWYHVDAAYGGAAGLSRNYPGILKGIERADSVTVDAHKWFFVPFVAGGILFRDRAFAEEAFQNAAGYIPPSEAADLPPTDYLKQGLAGTRRFNALKVWMAFKHLGADWYAGVVDRQLRLARKVAAVIGEMPDWRIAVPPATAIVTFRYEPEDLRAAVAAGGSAAETARKERDRLQIRIAKRIQEEGRFWISAAPVPGGFALRLNVISWLTDEGLVDTFLGELPRYAREAVSGSR